MSLFAEVIVKKSLQLSLDYIIPPSLEKTVKTGMFVKISLNRKELHALVIKIKDKSSVATEKIKPIISLVEDLPPLSRPLLQLITWIADYYYAPVGSVVNTAVPSFTMPKSRKKYQPQKEQNIPQEEPALSEEQKKAVSEIKKSLHKKTSTVHLLFGITGSGKTLVYLHICRELINNNQSVLIMVPEIALTPQLKKTLESGLGREVALFHSSVPAGERNMNWKRTARGEIKIVLGARSALFAPLKNLGLIVIDEEHEKTFKQEESPRYNARDAAIVRASIEGCPVILSSATPSLESYYNALRGKYNLIKLTERPKNINLPEVSLIDMNTEADAMKRGFFFSQMLLNQIDLVLSRKEQIILFVNRRGFSNCAYCKDCKNIIKCKNCSISLTLHKRSGKMICHRCDYQKKTSSLCPSCGKKSIRFLGFGTEKAESTLAKIFPQARIGRIDSDTISKKDYLKETWKKFMEKDIDILIGTQMIAKGLHNENITLSAILNADIGLNMPDFRAGENTFQLLTQVAGRSGRGDKPGKVIVQTNAIEHPVISESLSQNFENFAARELSERKSFGLPPFSRIILITVRHSKEEKAAKLSAAIYTKLLGSKAFNLFPPSPSPISKIRNRYRFQVMISTLNIIKTLKAVKNAINSLSVYERGFIVTDIDPQNTL